MSDTIHDPLENWYQTTPEVDSLVGPTVELDQVPPGTYTDPLAAERAGMRRAGVGTSDLGRRGPGPLEDALSDWIDAGGTIEEFLRRTKQIGAVSVAPAALGAALKLPEWDNRNDCPKKDHVRNTEALLKHYGVWPVRYNLMVHDLEVTVPGRKMAVERTANYTVDFVENRAAEHDLSRGPIIKHIKELAKEYHPVLDWIESKPWDGKDRMPELWGTIQLGPSPDPEFCGLLIHRWMLGAAASLLPELEQKFMAQGVLVAQGLQGRGKTRWLRSLVPNKNWVMSGEFIDPNNRDVTQRVTSVWLCELGEVDAVFRKADVAALKAFITRPDDVYRSAYDRRPERVIRRTVFFASVNEAEYLVDKTGNRRWWTIPIERCNPDHTVDMQQLWAQLVVEVRAGAAWWLNEDECERLNAANKQHEQEDVMTSMIADYWEPLEGDKDNYAKTCWQTLHKICEAMPAFSSRLPTQAETNRLGSALRELGFQNKRDNKGRLYLARRRGC